MRGRILIGSMVALLLPAVAFGAAQPGKYTGKSSQKKNVSMTVSSAGDAISVLDFDWVGSCKLEGFKHDGGSRVRDIELADGGTTFTSSGSYSTKIPGAKTAKIRETISGRFSADGRTASGTFRVRSSIYKRGKFIDRCDTKVRTFKVTRRA